MDAIQFVLPALNMCHPVKGHSSLPEKGMMPQKGHSAGYRGVHVLGDAII